MIQICQRRNVKNFEPSYEIFHFFVIQICQRENVKNFEPSYGIFHFFVIQIYPKGNVKNFEPSYGYVVCYDHQPFIFIMKNILRISQEDDILVDLHPS